MILSNKKIIFIHIPKTGGSSVELSLEPYADENITSDHRGTYFNVNIPPIQKEIMDSLGVCWQEYKHISALDYKKFLGSEYDDYFVFSIIRNPIDRISSLFRWANHDPNSRILSINPEDGFRPTMLANYYISDDNGDIIVDKLLDFDNLSQEYSNLMSKLNIDVQPLEHTNKTSGVGIGEHRQEIFNEKYNKEILLFRKFKNGELLKDV